MHLAHEAGGCGGGQQAEEGGGPVLLLLLLLTYVSSKIRPLHYYIKSRDRKKIFLYLTLSSGLSDHHLGSVDADFPDSRVST